jgi:hypothetical protein
MVDQGSQDRGFIPCLWGGGYAADPEIPTPLMYEREIRVFQKAWKRWVGG